MSDSDLIVEDYDGKAQEYEQAPKGSHVAVIGRVWYVGLQDGPFGIKEKVCVAYELEAREASGKRFVLFSPYAKSAHPKSGLRAVVDACIPHVSEAERSRFNIRKIEGQCVLANVIHNERGKARVQSVSPVPARLGGIQAEGDYSEPFGLAKWYLDHRVTKDQEGQASRQDAAPAGDVADKDIPF